MPAGYFYIAGVPPSLLGKAMPPLALTWAQAAGGIVSSLADMTTWDRALYSGQLLPPRQQHQLESLVSEATGQPIASTTLADPTGYGLGVAQQTTPRPARSGTTKARPRLPGRCTCTSPAPASSSPSPLNSATGNDDMSDLAGSVYQTLQNAAQSTPADYGVAAADTGQATQPGRYPRTCPPRA